MLDKRGQGLSITVIVAAVIGLIIIVVLIMMLTGKLGGFSKGVEGAVSCENTCTALGMKVKSPTLTESGCIKTSGGRVIPGKFSDVGEDRVCCCWDG